MQTRPDRTVLFSVLLIVALCLAVYGNTIGHGFVYDDTRVVEGNFFIRQGKNLAALFNGRYFTVSGEITYRPAVTLSYFLDYALWKSRPAGFHLTNVLLHALNSVLVYFLFRRLLIRQAAALAAALLFAVHPIASEPVNAVSFREDLLCFAFSLAAFLAYLAFPPGGRGSRKYFPLCLAFFLSALLSKETAAILPLLFLLADFCFEEKFLPAVKRKLSLYVALFAVLGFYLLLRFVWLRNPEEPPFYPPPLYQRMLTMSTTVFFYLRLLVVPGRLSVEYLYPLFVSALEAKVLLSLFGLAVIVFLAGFSRRRRPDVFFGIAWFFLALLPTANIVPIFNPVAERFLYFPLAGFCLLGALAGEALALRLKPAARPEAAVLLAIVLAVYSSRAFRRNMDWRDDFTLSFQTVKACPQSARFHHNLGTAYEARGNPEAAIAEYQQALAINSEFTAARNNLGCAYANQGNYDQAIREFERALKFDPRHARTLHNLGIAYRRKKMLPEAVPYFQEALKIDPNYLRAHDNLGITYQELGRDAEAATEFEAALRLDPDDFDALNNLGEILSRKGDAAAARKLWERCLRLRPDRQDVREKLDRLK